MKINKLFHWLYAILMLLPIFAIGFTCAYTIFNKNAYESYYGEEINEVQTENNISLLKNNNNYAFICNVNPTSEQTSNFIYVNGIDNLIGVTSNNILFINRDNVNAFSIYYNPNNGFYSLRYQLHNDVNIYYFTFYVSSLTSFSFDFTPLSNTSNTNTDMLNYIYLKTYNKYSYLDNVFYYSLDEMKNNPLFSWANNNFLTNPFSYLFNLFGVPTNSGIMTLLSYWLDISIIWLVFDLIMYVPLLAHRWIDKGMVD